MDVQFANTKALLHSDRDWLFATVQRLEEAEAATNRAFEALLD